MTRFLLRWLINAVALYLAIRFVPGIGFAGGWLGLLWLALIFGLVNAFLRPVLQLLTCPLILLTLGLFTLVINMFMLKVTEWVGNAFGLGLTIAGWWPLFLGSLVISIVSIMLSLIFKDELRGRHRR
ncbi:MAG TPA: phage holin family protein [Anaerolineales bacterium]|nr:phage holin family protein [Anaerolineales bacterium]